MSKSKDKGTKGETQVVNYLLEHGFVARRRALSGSKDKGDIEFYPISRSGKVTDPYILEVKTGKQTNLYSRSTKEEWLEQTRVEAKNADVPEYGAFLVINTYGRNIADAEVWSANGGDFWYLDEFIERMKG